MSPCIPHCPAIGTLGLLLGMTYHAPVEGRNTPMSALPSPSKSFPVPADVALSAWTKSNRPWPISGPMGTACAVTAAALDSLTLDRRFRNKAAAPETKGALKEVPHPAA